jgi:hypothetical protein
LLRSASIISIKRLHDAAITRIDGSNSSFWSAQNNTDKAVTGLGLLDRQRVKIWLRNTYAELDSATV